MKIKKLLVLEAILSFLIKKKACTVINVIRVENLGLNLSHLAKSSFFKNSILQFETSKITSNESMT